MTAAFPRPTTTLVGRDSELAALLDRLHQGARLITLTGLGGMGKTRLAVEVCLALEGRRSAYCHAARAEGLEGLASAIAAALEVTPSADLLRVDPFHALALVTRAEAPHVVVLDDFEHLADRSAAAIERWLFLSPATTLIVTSRRTIGAPSEHVVAVEPLCAADAARLLTTRARQLSPEWGADDRDGVAHLATHLEGIPLAIELAAAQARVGGPRTLEHLWRARQTDPRITARDAAVRWSWDHLDPAARRDLTTLAVIAGSFDLELAAAVLERSADDAVVRVAELVHDSLIASTSSATPYRLLDTVREFVHVHGDPEVVAAATDAFTAAILARTTPILMRRVPIAPVLFNRLRADASALAAIVQRGIDSGDAQRLDAAFVAATLLVFGMRVRALYVLPFDLLTRLCLDPHATLVPVARRIAYGAELVTVIDCVPPQVAPRLVERFDDWFAEADACPARLHLRWRVAAALARSWRYREVAELAQRLEIPPATDQRFALFATFVRLMIAQKLGTLTPNSELLSDYDRLIDQASTDGRLEWSAAVINQAYFAVQLARPQVLTSLHDHIARLTRLDLVLECGYLRRELARAEIDHGQLEAGMSRLAAVMSRDELVFGAERLETELELAAAQIEAGDLTAAAASLVDAAPWVGASSYISAYHVVLSSALAWLGGNAPGPTVFTPTDTTEDLGFAVWAALGTPALASACRAAEAVAPINARVRQALRVAYAVRAIHAGSGIAVALDGASFRIGDTWIDLRKRLLPGALLNLLVDAATRERGRTIPKESLAAQLWPGERMEPATRDNRLHVTVASLRKLGLGAAVVHRDGGFGIDPGWPILRLDPRALP